MKKILEKLDVLDRLYHITVDKKMLVKRSEKEKVNSTKTFGLFYVCIEDWELWNSKSAISCHHQHLQPCISSSEDDSDK